MKNLDIRPQDQDREMQATSYHNRLPAKLLLICVLSCSVVAFSLGRLLRIYLVPDIDFTVLEEISRLQKAQQLNQSSGRSVYLVPTPQAKGGKIVPETIYTTKNFDTRRSAVIVSQFLQPSAEGEFAPKDDILVPAPQNSKLTWNDSEIEHYDKDDEEHLPAGQHLLVDIDGLDAAFLNSESRLATAMISMVDNSGLTLLSYHCHGLSPEGVSCAGVLLESHVAFHTWPTEGVITLDLFTCGSTSLLDSLPLIEDLFVIPRSGEKEAPPTVLWAYKRRGFNEQSGFVGSRDTFAYPLGIHGMEYKKEVGNLISVVAFYTCMGSAKSSLI
jgi:S-adenosylmethionine decarboxylase proenzyme